MNAARQIAAVTWMGLSTIPQRRGAALVIVLGMACAVGAFISILTLSSGLMATIAGTGRDDRAVVLSRGSQWEFASSLTKANAVTIADAPGVVSRGGAAIVSAEALAWSMARRKSDGAENYIMVRGIGPAGPALRPEIRIVGGRMFRPGRYEVIVGRFAEAQFAGLKPGGKVNLPEGDWTVTGIFDSGGDARASEIIADAATLQAAMRSTAYKSMTVRLDSPVSLARFKSALSTNPTLAVEVVSERELLQREWKNTNGLLAIVAYVVGGIMGLGAMFGAINTMYSAVSARTREIATLRALGFGAGAVVVSVLAEAMLFCLAGASIGVAASWLAFNGNLHTLGAMVIRLAITPGLAAIGIAFALGIGFIGGIFPAIRAARLPVATALRAT